jgi:hypothetical protein
MRIQLHIHRSQRWTSWQTSMVGSDTQEMGHSILIWVLGASPTILEFRDLRADRGRHWELRSLGVHLGGWSVSSSSSTSSLASRFSTTVISSSTSSASLKGCCAPPKDPFVLADLIGLDPTASMVTYPYDNSRNRCMCLTFSPYGSLLDRKFGRVFMTRPWSDGGSVYLNPTI